MGPTAPGIGYEDKKDGLILSLRRDVYAFLVYPIGKTKHLWDWLLVQRILCTDRLVMMSGRDINWQGIGVKVSSNQCESVWAG